MGFWRGFGVMRTGAGKVVRWVNGMSKARRKKQLHLGIKYYDTIMIVIGPLASREEEICFGWYDWYFTSYFTNSLIVLYILYKLLTLTNTSILIT